MKVEVTSLITQLTNTDTKSEKGSYKVSSRKEFQRQIPIALLERVKEDFNKRCGGRNQDMLYEFSERQQRMAMGILGFDCSNSSFHPNLLHRLPVKFCHFPQIYA
ncbi:hypothetical protein NC652_004946 [Populus alba x Populus x berolinensis]|nr:hypothetical protein NC652_004946 [Populus alba x Populus x berolinensis]